MNFENLSPQTLDEAAAAVLVVLTPEDRAYCIKNGFAPMHHGLGTAIRNAWLWDDPDQGKYRPLAQWFRATYGLGHADDMSGLILSLLDHQHHPELGNFDAQAQAKRYRDFWVREYGVDPLTQKPIK